MSLTSIHPKRTGLQLLIVSVVISAAMAIFALLKGEFGDTDGHIILTSLAVAAASVLTLANGIVLEQGRRTTLASLAIVISIIGFALLIVTIWKSFEPDGLAKAAASVIFLGVALTHWSLVSIARIPARYRWLQVSAYPLSGLLAAFLIGAMWEWIEGSENAQLAGIIAVLTVAVTIILPVLQRLSPERHTGRRAIKFCPYCGKTLNGSSGRITCPSCDRAFRVRRA